MSLGPAGTPPTDLELSRHTAVYRSRLARGVQEFEKWVTLSGMKVPESYASSRTADSRLVCFVQLCYDSAVPYWIVCHAVLGVQQQHRWRGQLHRAWDALKSWRLRLPSQHRTPMPLTILRVAFAEGLSWALESRSEDLRLPLVLCVRVAFFGLLRPAEVTGLRFRDIMIRRSNGVASSAILCLTDPKNRASLGKSQFAVIRDPGTAQYLEWMSAGAPRDARLWPSSGPRFRELFQLLLARVGLDSVRFTPASLRAGGATWLFLEIGCDVQRLQYLGRWTSTSSLYCYIQEAVAHLIWIQLEPTHEAHLSHLADRTAAFWASAPSEPYLQLLLAPRGWRALRAHHAPQAGSQRSFSEPPLTWRSPAEPLEPSTSSRPRTSASSPRSERETTRFWGPTSRP